MKIDIANTIVAPLRKRTGSWYIVWFFLFFIVPFLLIDMQGYIINGIYSGAISSDTSLFTFYANTTNPSSSSLFFTNYVHKDWSNCLNNVEAYWGLIALIFIFETYLLLPTERERTEKSFYFSLLLFFLIIPFSISGIIFSLLPII